MYFITKTCPKCSVEGLGYVSEEIPSPDVSQSTVILSALRSGGIPAHFVFRHVVALPAVLI